MTTNERSEPMIAAAHRRHEQTRQKAIEALRHLDAVGESISFASVARTAHISRAFLYRETDIRDEIDRLHVALPLKGPRVPVAERASDVSLRRTLEALRARLAELQKENRLLREALARKFGTQRAAALISSELLAGHVSDMSPTSEPF